MAARLRTTHELTEFVFLSLRVFASDRGSGVVYLGYLQDLALLAT